MSDHDAPSSWRRDAVDVCVSTAVVFTIFLLLVS
jgi:hypothetical protein